MGTGDDDGGGGVGGEDMYNGIAKPVLVLVLDLYSNNDAISVSDSRYSSYPAYTDTDYFYRLTTGLKEIVYDFDLRRSFYSKQGF